MAGRSVPALRVAGVLSRACFGLAVLASLVVLFAPGRDVPPSPPGVDKIVHGSLFAPLAFTACWAGLRRPVSLASLLLYAALSEVIQAVAPLGRDGSVGDWLADAAGVLTGLLVWNLVDRERSRPG